MAAPTRAEIEAAVRTPAYAVEADVGGGWYSVLPQYVVAVSGAVESAGGDSGLSFGAEAAASARVALRPAAALAAWDGGRVRVRYGFGTSDLVTRVAGVVVGEDADGAGPVTYTVAGWDEPIARASVYTPLLHRVPASTATTLTSVEDPASPSCQTGLVNRICWAAGGRPFEQAASYPDALFFYSCDTSLLVPEWSWAAGENGWEELGRLARAHGLVIYQDADGVLKCRHALNLAGIGSYTFTDGVFVGIRRAARRGAKVGAARCAYTARRVQPRQIVYEDTTPRPIGPFDTLTLTLDMAQPVYDYVADGATLPADTVTGCTTEGEVVTCSATIVRQAAARLTIEVGNASNHVLVISRVQLRGRPLAPVEEGMVTIGAGTPEREIGSDTGIYVQSRAHAERLCRLYVDYYGTPRPVYTLRDCRYDPDRYVGEAVRLTYTPWGLASVPCRLTAIRHSATGSLMEVDLVPMSGIPTLDDVFVWGQSYSGATVKTLGY